MYMDFLQQARVKTFCGELTYTEKEEEGIGTLEDAGLGLLGFIESCLGLFEHLNERSNETLRGVSKSA